MIDYNKCHVVMTLLLFMISQNKSNSYWYNDLLKNIFYKIIFSYLYIKYLSKFAISLWTKPMDAT